MTFGSWFICVSSTPPPPPPPTHTQKKNKKKKKKKKKYKKQKTLKPLKSSRQGEIQFRNSHITLTNICSNQPHIPLPASPNSITYKEAYNIRRSFFRILQFFFTSFSIWWLLLILTAFIANSADDKFVKFSQPAFFINIMRAVIGPPATLTGR